MFWLKIASAYEINEQWWKSVFQFYLFVCLFAILFLFFSFLASFFVAVFLSVTRFHRNRLSFGNIRPVNGYAKLSTNFIDRNKISFLCALH